MLASGMVLSNMNSPFVLSQNGLTFFWNTNTDGKTLVDPRLDGGEDTAIIITVGQSNAANHLAGSYTATGEVDNIFLDNGGVYDATEPLLGCTGPLDRYGSSGVYVEKSNFALRLADKLIDDNRYDRVILFPIAIAGTSIADWADGGSANHRIRVACERLDSLGYTVTFIIQVQGEKDNELGTSAASYETSCESAIQTWRDCGVNAPYFVGITSWLDGSTSSSVTTGQANTVNGSDILTGADSDSLDNSYRYDGTHFNATGADDLADLWFTVLTNYLDS